MKTIRSFWHGPITLYEKLCICSYLHHGHSIEIYSYHPLDLPIGAISKDAAEILPQSAIFYFSEGPGKGSVAGFVDLFRYKLIYEKGGIWTDLDILCLKSYEDLPESFLVYQEEVNHPHAIGTGVFGFTKKSDLCLKLFNEALCFDEKSNWGDAGPLLATRLYNEGPHEDISVLSKDTFYAISYQDALSLGLVEQYKRCELLTINSHGSHWWNEIWRRSHIPKHKLPPAESFLSKRAEILLKDIDFDCWDTDLFDYWVNAARDIDFLKSSLAEKDQVINSMTSSLTWRLTKSLRRLEDMLK